MQPSTEQKPGDRSIKADTINALIAELMRQGRFHVEGAELDSTGSGVLLKVPVPNVGFWARLTGEASGKYSWTEQARTSPGTFNDVAGGRSGTTTLGAAREVNGVTGLATGTYVFLIEGAGVITGGQVDQEYLFSNQAAAGGGSDPDATHTVRGYVSLSNQYLGAGDKYVDQLRLPYTVGVTGDTKDVLVRHDPHPPTTRGMARIDFAGGASADLSIGGRLVFPSTDTVARRSDGVAVYVDAYGSNSGAGDNLFGQLIIGLMSNYVDQAYFLTCKKFDHTGVFLSLGVSDKIIVGTDGIIHAGNKFRVGSSFGTDGVTGTFKSGDPTPKTITVQGGLIVGIT